MQAQETKTNPEVARTIDSLQILLNTSKVDTTKINILDAISWQYTNMGCYDQALQYGMLAIKIANENGDKKIISTSLRKVGNVYLYQLVYEKAIKYYLASLKVAEEANDKINIANSLNNLGNVYARMAAFSNAKSNYEKSLEFHLRVIDLRKKYDKRNLTSSLLNISNAYLGLGQQKKAIDYLLQAAKEFTERGDNNGMVLAKTSLGEVYLDLAKKSGREEYYTKAEEYFMERLAVYQKKELQLFQKKEWGRKANLLIRLGEIRYLHNRLNEAINYLSDGVQIAKRAKTTDALKNGALLLAEALKAKGDYKQALVYHKLYANLKDTLLSEQSSKQIAEMNTKYDSEKKDKELIKKDAEISKQQAETEKQNLQRNFFILGFALVLLLSFFIYRSYRQKQKANKLLEEKNILIENQKQLVEEKNLKITDSITYAKRIQQAILPSQEIIKSSLPESFVFFNPKNIVSGDFYWMHAIDKYNILLAAVDCTGHGVPGALMSMMGYNLLEQVVKGHNTFEPAMILNELSRLVIESLRQTEAQNGVKDGMDISICKINFQNYELEYAGAHNSLYLIRNGVLTETKADRRSVGISTKSVSFSNHKIKLEKGDCLYIFSDGYVDQKGGPDNTKIFYQPFRDLLTQVHQLPMEQQRVELEKVMLDWKGEKEQIDDMLVIGIRI